MTFSERLRATRELVDDLPAYELSELAGLSGGYVAHIESERRKKPALDDVAKIARVLGVTVDYLASGTEPAPTKEQVTASVQAARAARPPKLKSDPPPAPDEAPDADAPGSHREPKAVPEAS